MKVVTSAAATIVTETISVSTTTESKVVRLVTQVNGWVSIDTHPMPNYTRRFNHRWQSRRERGTVCCRKRPINDADGASLAPIITV
jgi:hypothetical protein